MHLARISTLNGLSNLRSAWNALAGPVPFQSWDWLEAWWRHYGVRESGEGPDSELCIVAVYDDEGTLRGLAPWYLTHTWTQGRVLRFLGTGEVCSDYLSLLVAPGWEARVFDLLATWLCGKRLSGGRAPTGDPTPVWDALELEAVPQHDTRISELVERMSWFGAPVERQPGPRCWRLNLPATWDAYLASLSKSHRKQLRRLERRLSDDPRAQWHTVRHLADFPRAFEILIDLHQRRRASLGEPGCFASTRFTSFHREVARRFCQSGQLRLHWLELAGEPIAVEYGLAGGGVAYAYQSGLDPLRLDEEPGRLAGVALLQSALADGLAAIDFLRGDEPYKAHWRAEPQPTWNLRLAAPGASARARHRLWKTGRGLSAAARGIHAAWARWREERAALPTDPALAASAPAAFEASGNAPAELAAPDRSLPTESRPAYRPDALPARVAANEPEPCLTGAGARSDS